MITFLHPQKEDGQTPVASFLVLLLLLLLSSLEFLVQKFTEV